MTLRQNDHWWAPVEAQKRLEADEANQPGKSANCLDIENESPWVPHSWRLGTRRQLQWTRLGFVAVSIVTGVGGLVCGSANGIGAILHPSERHQFLLCEVLH
jgi:hypothetical protein